VTTGSQQALDLCGRVFIDPGDVVLAELPTYTGAIMAFGNAQARLVGVAQDGAGINLEDLDAALRRERSAGRRVAFVYVVPNFQNPTGLLMTLNRRQQLLQWSAERDVLIVEDDPYGALHFEDVASAADTRPIKADDVEGRVVYLSSFSKTVAPGFRVAWVAAPCALVDRMEVAKQSTDLCSGGLDQRIILELWKRGVLASRLPVLRECYQTRRTLMERALRRELGDLISWPQPRGGFFIWASFPDAIDTDRLLNRAMAHGVAYVPGSAFFVEPQVANCARLAFSGAPRDRIDTAITRLAAAVREELDATVPVAAQDRPEARSATAPTRR
jgi:2-aminoadipate transaminase